MYFFNLQLRRIVHGKPDHWIQSTRRDLIGKQVKVFIRERVAHLLPKLNHNHYQTMKSSWWSCLEACKSQLAMHYCVTAEVFFKSFLDRLAECLIFFLFFICILNLVTQLVHLSCYVKSRVICFSIFLPYPPCFASS